MNNKMKETGISLLCESAISESTVIRVTTEKGRCRYHLENSKDFGFNQLAPDGLCIHAFHSAYSSCLRLLYTGKKNNFAARFICPDVKGSVEFETLAVRHSNIRFRLMQTLKYCLRRIGVPCDYLIKRILIKVTNSKNVCPMGHKIGDTFEFNLGDKPEICPASFESVYPVFYAVKLKQALGEADVINTEPLCLECPSHSVNIRYHIPKDK